MMKKDKLIYIFVAHGLAGIGGMELYTLGMSQYLESQGCIVRVLDPNPADVEPMIPALKKYLQQGGGCAFLTTPPYKFSQIEQTVMLNTLVMRLNLPDDLSDYDIIVESCSGQRTLWAELLATRLNARHIFIASEEHYREGWQCYEENLPFFYFKWQRGEIVGSDYTVKKLFNGYKNIQGVSVEYPSIVREADPIQDVDYPDLNQIPQSDYNICHIGRHGKNYVPHMIAGIGEFARRHPDKKINFICIGDMKPAMPVMQENFKNLNNMYIAFCGILSPIPRILFSKMDVVIGISQTAIFSANEGALTIVASATTPEKTPGLYGYDTDQSLDGEPTFTYAEALENVLVNHKYDDKEYFLPKLEPAEESYKNIWTILDAVSKIPKAYYTEVATPRIRNCTYIFPFGRIARGAKIILYGATEIAKDYKKQVESQNNCPVEYGSDFIKYLKPASYCEIVATVDEQPENFDDTIVGLERLKDLDYDAIVIAVFQWQLQSALQNIMRIVPEINGRIVYALNPLFE